MRQILVLGCLGLFILSLIMARGSRKALWWGWPVGLLLFYNRIRYGLPGGLLLSPQTVPVLCLSLGFFTGGSMGPLTKLRWNWADTIAVTMAVLQYVSDLVNDRAIIFTLPTIFCYTVGPYLLGRIYLRSIEDLKAALRPLAICLLILTLCLCVECFTGLNVFRLVGAKGGHSSIRLGRTRAGGPLGNPIWMGMALLSILPLALEAAHIAKQKAGPGWWRWLPWAVSIGILTCLSRGPIAGIPIVLGIYKFLRAPAWRLPLGLLAVVALLLFTFAFDQLKSVMMNVGGEGTTMTTVERRIMIGAQEFIYTGTDHRWLLFRVYESQLRNAGAFGYGYGNEQGYSEASLVHHSFTSIDNYFIAWVLTYGYAGVTLAYGLVLLLLYPLIRVALNRANPYASLAAAVLGGVVGFQATLWSIALVRDLLVYWMFLAGLAVSVGQLGMSARTRVPAQRPPQPGPAAAFNRPSAHWRPR